MIVVRDAGSLLVHSDDGSVDHPRRRVVTSGKRIHDLLPDASPPAAT
jgi:hypothetical protein